MPANPISDRWIFDSATLIWGQRTYILGILNVTPDSFSDGGDFNALPDAIDRAHVMVEEGADAIDVGGQSTRPHSTPISVDEELQRVIPVVRGLREGACGRDSLTVPISVDTTRAVVAREAIAAGAGIVNDVSAGTYDDRMLPTLAELKVPAFLMHLRGTPQTMQQLTDYGDLVGEIISWLGDRLKAAEAAGIARSQLAIDPGIGFAKTVEQNLQLLRELSTFRSLGCPILIGSSRKSFIGQVCDRPHPKERLLGTAATLAASIAGGADWVRVHDVAAARDVCRMSDAIWRCRP